MADSIGVRGDHSDEAGCVESDETQTPDRDGVRRERVSATERRAELRQRIEAAGHPHRLNQTELADEFGVSQQMISKDFKKIGGEIRDELDDDRRTLAVNSTVQRAIVGLLDEERWYRAGKLALEWDSWVQDSSTDTGTDSLVEVLADSDDDETC